MNCSTALTHALNLLICGISLLRLDAELFQPRAVLRRSAVLRANLLMDLVEDNVDPPGLADGQHSLKLSSAFRAGAGDEAVRISS